VAIVLKELNIPYTTINVDFAKGDHKKEEFLRICPNGRIPAIIDHDNDDLAVWESGAILLYLVQKYDTTGLLWPRDEKLRTQIMSWLMFQVSGHSVMQGQAVYFSFFSGDYSTTAISRYVNETRRVYGVLEMRLAERREEDEDVEDVWLVGRECTLADLSFLTWARVVDRIGIDLEEEFPEVNKWIHKMMERPRVKLALSGSSTDVDKAA